MIRAAAILSVSAALALAAGCAPTTGQAPVINKAPHRVIPADTVAAQGDSIYAIAWRFGLDFQDIAEWNGLRAPYKITAGQRLRLQGSASPGASQPPVKSATVAAAPTKPAPAKSTPPAAPAKSPAAAPGQWQWPAVGQLVGKFSRSRGRNGIQIAGAPGSPIRATAAGQVVYAGEGLRGYGKLIIVKHSPAFLSAYAHNRAILVAEGERVAAGRQIAQMGSSGAPRTMLHFEIRRDGKPVDPLKFLP